MEKSPPIMKLLIGGELVFSMPIHLVLISQTGNGSFIAPKPGEILQLVVESDRHFYQWFFKMPERLSDG